MAAFDMEPPPLEEPETIKRSDDEADSVGVTLSSQSEFPEFEIFTEAGISNTPDLINSPSDMNSVHSSHPEVNGLSLKPDISNDPLPHVEASTYQSTPIKNFTEQNFNFQGPKSPAAEVAEPENEWAGFSDFSSDQTEQSSVQVIAAEIPSEVPVVEKPHKSEQTNNSDISKRNSIDTNDTNNDTNNGFSRGSLKGNSASDSHSGNNSPELSSTNTALVSDAVLSDRPDVSTEKHSVHSSDCVNSSEKELSSLRESCDAVASSSSPVAQNGSLNEFPAAFDVDREESKPKLLDSPNESSRVEMQLQVVQYSDAIDNATCPTPTLSATTLEDDFGGFETATLPPARGTGTNEASATAAAAAAPEPKTTEEQLLAAEDASDDKDFADFESAPLSPVAKAIPSPPAPAPALAHIDVSASASASAGCQPVPVDATGRLQLLFDRFFPLVPSRPFGRYTFSTHEYLHIVTNLTTTAQTF